MIGMFSIRDERRIYAALMERGIAASHLTITVVVDYSDEQPLDEFFRHVAAQHYDGVTVLVVFRSKQEARDDASMVRRTARHNGIRVQTASMTGQTSLEQLVRRRVRTDLVLRLSTDDRLSPRCFEYLSMVFTQPIHAVHIRQSIQLDHRLSTAGLALSHFIESALSPAWVPAPRLTSVAPYTALRTRFVGTPYKAVPMLSGWYRVYVPGSHAPIQKWTPLLTAALIGTSLFVWYVLGANTALLITATIYACLVAVISGTVLIRKNERPRYRYAVALMAPFFPVILVLTTIRGAIRLARFRQQVQ